MVFNTEKHKQLTLELIKRSSFVGDSLELACEFKLAVMTASVLEPKKDGEPSPPNPQ